MTRSGPTTTPMSGVLAVIVITAALTGCGGADGADLTATAVSTSTSTTRPAPSTTARPTTTAPETLPPETLPPETLPTPIAPPPDGAIEPEVVVGTIEIPAIGLSTTLYSGITLHTLDKGPGHWPGTAAPGSLGNAVVAAHRVSGDRPFRRIDELQVGDSIIYVTADGRFEYRVTGSEVVEPSALWITEQTRHHRTTLFACHPPGSTAYRYVVYGELVGDDGTA